MTLGGFESLMAKNVLDFLHPETPLIQKGTASMTGQMPMHSLLDACCSSYLADDLVAMTIVADFRQPFQRTVTRHQFESLTTKDIRQRNPDQMTSLQLIDRQNAVPELAASE